MDPRLLRFYNDELTYLREAAREFGEEHESVAGRLGLKTPTDPDPYVERLLEGVAYLGARVQLKMADQYPEFTSHLLHAIQPHYLAPMPSICIAGFEPRLAESLLTVERADSADRHNAVTYVIRGDITAAAHAMPVKFRIEVDPETVAVDVRE